MSTPNNKRKTQSKVKRGTKKVPRAAEPMKNTEKYFAPSAMARIVKTSKPNMVYSTSGMVVTHREYFDNVAAYGGTFDPTRTQAYALNPGMASTFPWLSQIATRFESYTFRSLQIIYETSRGTGISGVMVAAIDFDAADVPPQTRQNIMSYAGATRSPIWGEFCLDARKINLQKFAAQRYVRDGALEPNLDIKTYDVGTLYVNGSDCDNAGNVGELYVEYSVEFRTPQIKSVLPSTKIPASVWKPVSQTQESPSTSERISQLTDLTASISLTQEEKSSGQWLKIK